MSVFDKLRNMRHAVGGVMLGITSASVAGNVIAGEEQDVGATIDAELNSDNATTMVQDATPSHTPDNIDLENNTITVDHEQASDIDLSQGDLSSNLQDFRSDLVDNLEAKLEPAYDQLANTMERLDAEEPEWVSDYQKAASEEQSWHQYNADFTIAAIDKMSDAELEASGYDNREDMKLDVGLVAAAGSLKGEVWGDYRAEGKTNGQDDGFNSPVFQDAQAEIEATAVDLESAEQLKSDMLQKATDAVNTLSDPSASKADKLAAMHKISGGLNPDTHELETGLISESSMLDSHMKDLTVEKDVDNDIDTTLVDADLSDLVRAGDALLVDIDASELMIGEPEKSQRPDVDLGPSADFDDRFAEAIEEVGGIDALRQDSKDDGFDR